MDNVVSPTISDDYFLKVLISSAQPCTTFVLVDPFGANWQPFTEMVSDAVKDGAFMQIIPLILTVILGIATLIANGLPRIAGTVRTYSIRLALKKFISYIAKFIYKTFVAFPIKIARITIKMTTKFLTLGNKEEKDAQETRNASTSSNSGSHIQAEIRKQIIRRLAIRRQVKRRQRIRRQRIWRQRIQRQIIRKQARNKETVNKETVNKETVNKETVNKETVNKETDKQAAQESTKSFDYIDQLIKLIKTDRQLSIKIVHCAAEWQVLLEEWKKIVHTQKFPKRRSKRKKMLQDILDQISALTPSKLEREFLALREVKCDPSSPENKLAAKETKSQHTNRANEKTR